MPAPPSQGLRPTAPIRYRCDVCGRFITRQHPGRIEFFGRLGNQYCYPPGDATVCTITRHYDCGEGTPVSYVIELPEDLNHLGDFDRPYGDSDSLADWRQHLSKKTWCTPEVLKVLDSWEECDAADVGAGR